MAYYIINKNSISILIILKLILKIKKIKTSLLKPNKLSIILETIYNTRLILISRILIMIVK